MLVINYFFFFQAEDGIRDKLVTGVQTCALPILEASQNDAYLAGADVILARLYATSYDLELFQPAIDWCEKGQRRFPNDPRFVECQLVLLSTKARDPDVGEAWRLAADRKSTRLNFSH